MLELTKIAPSKQKNIMKRKSLLLLAIATCYAFLVFGQDQLIVEGDIRVSDDSSIRGIDEIKGFNDLRFAPTEISLPTMVINPSGYVGIGNFGPEVDLVVKQINDPTGDLGELITNPGGLMIEDNGTDESAALFFIDNSNNLGIAFGAGAFFTKRVFIRQSDGNYFSSSDLRLKKNINGLEDVLSKVMALRPSKYQFRDQESEVKDLGLIAQEVEKYFPEVVATVDGTKAICYAKLSVVAIKAIQEQQEEIERLRLVERRLGDLEEAVNRSE